MRLTDLQKSIVARMLNGCGFISFYRSPGANKGQWFIQRPYSEEDGRACEGLLRKGALLHLGDDEYKPSAEACRSISPEALPDWASNLRDEATRLLCLHGDRK